MQTASFCFSNAKSNSILERGEGFIWGGKNLAVTFEGYQIFYKTKQSKREHLG